MANIFEVTLLTNRGTNVSYEKAFTSLPKATKVFQTLAGSALSNPDACVMLALKTGPSSATVLAAKSTDGRSVEFYAVYYAYANFPWKG